MAALPQASPLPAATATTIEHELAWECTRLVSAADELRFHEDAVTSQPYDLKAWMAYLDAAFEQEKAALGPVHKTAAQRKGGNNNDAVAIRRLHSWIARRALSRLPRSYKLWKLHWEHESHALHRHVANDDDQKQERLQATLRALQHALTLLSHCPRVWIVYLELLTLHPGCVSITQLRRTCNQCLTSLPVAQHEKVWPGILALVQATPDWHVPVATQARLGRRRVQIAPMQREQLAQFCLQHGQWAQAAQTYRELWNDLHDDEHLQAYLQLCSQHPRELQAAGIPWEAHLRSALLQQQAHGDDGGKTSSSSSSDATAAPAGTEHSKKYLHGLLWSYLADAWVRQGQFGLARSVYEEGLQHVSTVRDFTILYDAYLQLEEGLLEDAVEQAAEAEEEAAAGEDAQQPEGDDWNILLQVDAANEDDDEHPNTANLMSDMEFAVARAEYLTSRRPVLLNAVQLRQSPHHVGAWLERGQLFQQLGPPGQAVAALQTALRTVVARQAVEGRPSTLVTTLVQMHEDDGQIERARGLLQQICRDGSYKFAKVDDWADCWATWIELELRHEQWDTALALARESVATKNKQIGSLAKSLRLWDVLLDLEESLGTVQTAKDAYNRALDIRAATVQHVLNYASFLANHNYFEESFTAYERGIEVFNFPHAGAKLLWKTYLEAFLARYGGAKVERARDLFQRCLENCPPEECSEFYLLNGDFEEKHGLYKRALLVYRDLCDHVSKHEKLTAFQLFVAKTAQYMGVTATRDIYQDAVEKLEERDAAKICVDFAQMETGLQEFERARSIYAYGAQLADPRRLPEYWKAWNEFEIANGNEESFREMLRVKRSVVAAFSTVNYNASGMEENRDVLSNDEAMAMIASQEGLELEKRQGMHGFVPSTKRTAAAASLSEVEERVAKLRKATGATTSNHEDKENEDSANGEDDDEIDIDDIDAEIMAAANDGETEDDEIRTKEVPAGVLSGLASSS